MIPTYHPQADGSSETNQTVEIAPKHYLAKLDDPDQWPTILPELCLVLFTSKSSTTGRSPSEIVYGVKMNEAVDLTAGTSPMVLSTDILQGLVVQTIPINKILVTQELDMVQDILRKKEQEKCIDEDDNEVEDEVENPRVPARLSGKPEITSCGLGSAT